MENEEENIEPEWGRGKKSMAKTGDNRAKKGEAQ